MHFIKMSPRLRLHSISPMVMAIPSNPQSATCGRNVAIGGRNWDQAICGPPVGNLWPPVEIGHFQGENWAYSAFKCRKKIEQNTWILAGNIAISYFGKGFPQSKVLDSANNEGMDTELVEQVETFWVLWSYGPSMGIEGLSTQVLSFV